MKSSHYSTKENLIYGTAFGTMVGVISAIVLHSFGGAVLGLALGVLFCLDYYKQSQS